MKTVAIFGGTFDPVHLGHLQSARELRQRLGVDELRMLPCHLPPHRDVPSRSSGQRLAMLKLACEGSELIVDDRELRRSGPSYSVETLRELRAELGNEVSLSWVMGTDAFCGLPTWHRWRELLALAHIIVMARPGESLPGEGELAQLLERCGSGDPGVIREQACGAIVPISLTPYPIAATEIRELLKNGRPVDDLLPRSVVNYIRQHHLYADG